MGAFLKRDCARPSKIGASLADVTAVFYFAHIRLFFSQAFCVSERFEPPGQKATYLKVKGREAWVVQRLEGDSENSCKKLPPPMDEVTRVFISTLYCAESRLSRMRRFKCVFTSLKQQWVRGLKRPLE